MKWFTKLTTIFASAKEIAAKYLALADKGVELDQDVAEKAQAIIATAEKFIPAQEAAPTTTLIPVPDQHAATLGATPLPATKPVTPGGQQ